MRQPAKPLVTLQREAIMTARRYLSLGKGEGTAELRQLARDFVAAREHFFTKGGEPDWLGRTHAYRTWVRSVMAEAGVPAEQLATFQAAVRYHSGNILREQLDADTLEDLGLQVASPRERSVVKRERASEVLGLFAGGGAELVDADEIVAAAEMMAQALRRVSLDATAGLGADDRRRVRAAIAAVRDRAGEIHAATSTRRSRQG